MGQDLFKYLPSEIISDILSRLPTQAIMSCKIVCKPWLDLLETPEFVKSHLSKPVSGLVVYIEGKSPKPYKVFEFVDEVKPKRRVCSWNMIFKFNLPCNAPPYSSADGLLFLCTRGMVSSDSDIVLAEYEWPRDLFICNPITREYIKLPCPPESSSSTPQVQMDTFGFGLNRMSGQYKLVRIFHQWKLVEVPAVAELVEPKCQVYTVGNGLWSRVSSAGHFKYEGNAKGTFLNGNLHWMVRDFEGLSVWISCFDLETELFSTFTLPSAPSYYYHYEGCLSVSVLKDSLCLCDNLAEDEIVIWLMKEYGVEKSWTKEFVINKNNFEYNAGLIWPIKTFENGDILIAWETYDVLLYFSRRTKTIRPAVMPGSRSAYYTGATSYTPSFLPLKTYVLENVTSF